MYVREPLIWLFQVTIDVNSQPTQNYSDTDLEDENVDVDVHEDVDVREDVDVHEDVDVDLDEYVDEKVTKVKAKSAPKAKKSWLQNATCSICNNFLSTDKALMKLHKKLEHSAPILQKKYFEPSKSNIENKHFIPSGPNTKNKLSKRPRTAIKKEPSKPSGTFAKITPVERQTVKDRCKVCRKVVPNLRVHFKKVHMKSDDYKCCLCNNNAEFPSYPEYLMHVKETHWNTERKSTKPMPPCIANFLDEIVKLES